MEGAEEAIHFAISVSGGICLWSAVTELMDSCGLSDKISETLHSLLKMLFPCSSQHTEILSALSENISANILGLGNAATPAGIRAAKGMAVLGEREAADELGMLVVLNTASIQLIPSTIAALRAAEGAAFDIIPAVWISSCLSVCAGITGAYFLKSFLR